MKIISGGQTGADRAALDAALQLGLDYGGAVPKGRKTEDGALDVKYSKMEELSTPAYPPRTAKNVRDSDATLIVTMGRTDRGTALTKELAARYRKPVLHVDLKETPREKAENELREWLAAVRPGVLNVAGSRESGSPGIYARARELLVRVLASY